MSVSTRKLTFLSSFVLGLNRTFCSVLFGFRKCNKINYIAHSLRIPGISVTSTPGTSFFHFWSIKPIRASDLLMFFLWRWNLKMSEFSSLCNRYSTAIGSSTFDGRGLPIGQLYLYLIILSFYLTILNCENVHRNMFLNQFYFHPHWELG